MGVFEKSTAANNVATIGHKYVHEFGRIGIHANPQIVFWEVRGPRLQIPICVREQREQREQRELVVPLKSHTIHLFL